MNLQVPVLQHFLSYPKPPLPATAMLRSQKDASNRKVFVTSKGNYIAVTPEDLLGKGTYGVVYRARNEKDPQDVKAIKTFTPETMDENEGIPPTTLREINALKVLQHPNVLKAEEIVLPQGKQALIEMFVVMELCKGTLKDKACEMIQWHLRSDPKYYNFPPGKAPSDLALTASYVREAKILSYQLLNALAYIHSRGVIHRDLKPVNIMWGFDGLLKFGDFGLARFMRGNQNSKDTILPITGEVQTMWYRAPEVLLGDDTYGAQVDDWSIGCVIAELFRFRKSGSTNRVEPDPLFNGKSDPETLLMIFETVGRPRVDLEPGKAYLAKLPYWSSEFPKWENSTLHKRVPLLDEDGIDLVSQLLKISPCERVVAKHLLNHRWFNDVKDEIGRKVQSWCVGLERGYEIMAAVDRLPRAQILTHDTKNRHEMEREKQHAAGSKAPTAGLNGGTLKSSTTTTAAAAVTHNQVFSQTLAPTNGRHLSSCSSHQHQSEIKQTAAHNVTVSAHSSTSVAAAQTSISKDSDRSSSAVVLQSIEEPRNRVGKKQRNQQQKNMHDTDTTTGLSSSLAIASSVNSHESSSLDHKPMTSTTNKGQMNIPVGKLPPTLGSTKTSNNIRGAQKSKQEKNQRNDSDATSTTQHSMSLSDPSGHVAGSNHQADTQGAGSSHLESKVTTVLSQHDRPSEQPPHVTKAESSRERTVSHSRRVVAELPSELPKVASSSETSTTTNHHPKINQGASSVAWTARSRSPDRAAGGNGGKKRNGSQRRLPPNQTQLTLLVKVPRKVYSRTANIQEAASSNDLQKQHNGSRKEEDVAQHPALIEGATKPRRQVSNSKRNGSLTRTHQ